MFPAPISDEWLAGEQVLRRKLKIAESGIDSIPAANLLVSETHDCQLRVMPDFAPCKTGIEPEFDTFSVYALDPETEILDQR